MVFTQAVIDEIKLGRKIQAIKLLREENGIGLKEAKEAIEAYIDSHSEIKEAFNANKSAGLSQERVLQIIILLVVVAVISMIT
ncbi:MAG: ribosomal protein L7/L12 [Methylophilaceae bacterium]